MKLFLTFSIIALLSISFVNANAQDEEPVEEIEPWQVSEVKFSFLKTQSFKSEELNNIVAASPGTDLNINTVINDMITIKKFYFDNGFFNAIVDSLLSYNKNDNEVIITYTIIENEQSRYNEINYVGLDSLSPSLQDSIYSPNNKQLQRGLIPGQTYSRAAINLEAARIITLLQNNGYAFAKRQEVKVTNIFSTNPNLQNKVDLDIYFQTGTITRFGKTNISISSNKYGITPDYIRRDLEYSEGEIYSKRKLDASNKKILSNAIIESSNFDFAEDSTDQEDGVTDISLKVSLRNKYELTPELLGYVIKNRFYAGVGLSFYDRFFLSGSRVLTASVRGLIHDIKYNRMENSVQVSESYLFGNPKLSGNITLGLNFVNVDTLNFTEISGKTTVNYDLPSFTYINKLIFSSEIVNQSIFINFTVDESTGFNRADLNINIFTSSLSASALHYGIDDPVFPTKGFNQGFTVQEGGLLGQLLEQIFNINVYKFIKNTVSNKIFFNLSDELKSKSVLGIKLNLGLIFDIGDNEATGGVFNGNQISVNIPEAPIDLLFTAGGGINNRGWRANTLGYVPNQELGGNFSIDGMFEHRLRPFINSSNTLIKDLGFVYFLDYGNVWENVNKFVPNQIAMSTGFGIRYYTIIGAVRLDLGLKLYDPNPGHVGVTNWIFQNGANLNDKYTIQFGIGNTF